MTETLREKAARYIAFESEEGWAILVEESPDKAEDFREYADHAIAAVADHLGVSVEALENGAVRDGGEWRERLAAQCGKTLVAQTRAEAAERRLKEAHEVVAFAASVIKCSEPWTATCEDVIGGFLRSNRRTTDETG